jgi:hypothetical protein
MATAGNGQAIASDGLAIAEVPRGTGRETVYEPDRTEQFGVSHVEVIKRRSQAGWRPTGNASRI